MKKISQWMIATCLLFLAFSPTLAQEDMLNTPSTLTSCNEGVDLTGQEFQVHHFGDFTGPLSFITTPLLAALEDATNYYNSLGGICGATITIPDPTTIDTGGVPSVSQEIYNRISTADPKPSLLILYSSDDSEILRERLAEDEIPVLISAGSIEGLYGEDGQTPGWIFATNPLYVDQLGHFCQYVSENLEQFPENPTIGYLSWLGAFGQAAYTPEVIAYCQAQGVGFIETPEYWHPAQTTDISNNILNLVGAGANIIYTNSLASGPFLISKTLALLGLLDQVQLAGVNWVLDTSVALLSAQDLAQGVANSAGLPAVDGMIGSMPFYWWSEANSQPGIAFIQQQFALNERPFAIQNIAYLLGFGIVEYWSELMIRTGNRVGFENIDGVAVKETIENTVFAPLTGVPIDFQGGALRDATPNRIAQLRFLGTDGGPATSIQDLDMSMGIPIPIVIPLSGFTDSPDLRPGGADVP
ncbi:MAG: ABC transporter substrate-binding protein [Anaerolineaceae bacterium]|nr:ABC transporter substrate-binding protein [Anaerolineaceae bacterium]